MKLERYGPNGEFIRIPQEIQMEARKAAIHRFVRKHPCKAEKLLTAGKIAPEDIAVVECALGRR
jgi:hypothetical protein